jgi:NAD(P)-dependent dehydrogenase (short-subunit alcohol dehydrogenase family)
MVLIREFLPGMLAQKKGHIVSIASMASFVAAPGLIDYCISKIGALYLTEGKSSYLPLSFTANPIKASAQNVFPSIPTAQASAQHLSTRRGTRPESSKTQAIN